MIYTFDKNQNLIGTYDEKEELTVANLNLKINKAATLDLEFPASKENVNSLKNVVFLAVPYPNNKQKLLFLRVMTRTDKEYTIELMAKEFAYQELATSGYIEDKRFKDANAKTLISGAVQGSGYTVSNVNVSGTAQLNFYYEDYLTAVSDVIEALGGEVIFYVTLSGNQISGRYVDYVIAQGTNTSKTFAYGSNLISVERQSDASEVYTAILPRGKGELVSAGEDDAPDGYGRRINIAEILWKKPTNPLDKPVGSLVLEDPTATAAFGQVNGTARLLLKTYEDIEDKNELINAAYRDLMQYNHPATQFTASVANIGDSALGDTIVIMHSDRDMSYRTRIFEIDYDLIEINNTVATFGDNLSKNNTSNMLTSVSRAINNVKETANFAVASANGIGNNYYGENEPANPKNGDTWFYTAGDGFGIRQYVNGQWVEYVNSKTSEQITAQVDAAISNAKEYADNLNTTQTQATNSVASDLAKKADELTKNQQAISSQATAYTDSAVADANSKAVSIGQSAAQNAQSALDAAKKDFTSSFASQASQTASMASEVDSKASQYASQAKSEAISAATSADGVVRTEFKSTTDSMTATIQQNKSDADGKIITAQTTATQALDGLATKVSQTEYNTKTGQLQTDLTETTQTANQAKTDIASIKQKDGEQDEKMNSIVSDVNGTKQTVSDLQTVQGKQSGDISTLKQRADGFDATVTKVNNLSIGGRNLLIHTNENGWTKLNVGNGTATQKFVPFINGYKSEFEYTKVSTDWSVWQQYGVVKEKIKPDTEYTVSFMINSPESFTPAVGLCNGASRNYLNELTKSNKATIAKKDTRIEINFRTFKEDRFPEASDQTVYINGFVGIKGVFQIWDLKLEAGNVATDWSPAPEDLSSATAKAQLTADNATLAINNYKTDADGRISKAQADIVVNANAISQKVSQTDYDKKTGDLTTSVNKAQQTADSATLSINNYKTDADGRISKAQADIKVNADAIATKVAKTDYDKKTGDLTTSVNKAQQTADNAIQTIGTYKETNDKRIHAAETNIQTNSDAIKSTVSKTDFDQATGKLSGDISTLQQRADGFEATVTKVNGLSVGGRNLYVNATQSAGYINGANGNLATQNSVNKEIASDYIAVLPNTAYTFQAWGSLLSGQQYWAGIGQYGSDKSFINRSAGVYGVSPVTTDVPNDYEKTTFITSANTYFIRVSSRTFGNYKVKFEQGNVPTDWTPAPEDIDSNIAKVKLTADGLYETVNNPTTGITTRLLTAEGTITTVQDKTNELTSKQTLTANGLTQEIADRKTGDSNTLQAGKDFTTSQITSYDTGMQSRLTQVSDGIMAQVSSTNLITDSSFVNATANWTLSGDVSWKINNEIMRKGVRVATFDNGSTNFDRKTSTLTSTPIYTTNLGGTQFYASIDIYAQSFGTSAYMKAEIVQKNSSGTTTKTTAIGGSFDTAMTDWNTYTADITLDPSTTQLYLQVTQYGGGKVSIARPYLGSTKLNSGDYISGASTDNTSTLKLFNNFFAFGIQSNTGEIISGINGDSSGLIITGKKITVSGDTTFIGNNFMDGAIIKNASIGSAQIADAAITNAKISNLDVNKLSGNVSSFIQTNWNGKYGATTIDANGMTVDTSGITTKFGSYGMTLNMTGESVGGIGVQGLTGKPSDYQGLAFWLDGNAEYMAWGARNNGATSGNPVLKLSWFRNTSAPSGSYSGFNFDDDVIFNRKINVPGATGGKFAFGTKNFQNANYAYFGNDGMNSGIAYGSVSMYLISDNTYYNLTRVIKALDSLGAVKIPSVINSDGTVKSWHNVTL